MLSHGQQDPEPPNIQHVSHTTNPSVILLLVLNDDGVHAHVMPSDRFLVPALGTTLVLWASSFVAIRVALSGFSVGGLSFGRLAIASLALMITASIVRVRLPARADLPRIIACGLSGMTAYQLLLNAGERTVPAGTASLLVNTAPLFAAVLAFALLRESTSPRARFGMILGFSGALVMTIAQDGSFQPSGGALLVLGAAASQALFFVLQKPLLQHYRGLDVTCYAVWSGTLLALPLLPAFTRDFGDAEIGPSMAMLFLGIGPSAIGFVTWAYAQARLPVATASNTLYLVPFLAIAIGWILLGETVPPTALAGGLLALTGVALGRRTGSNQRAH